MFFSAFSVLTMSKSRINTIIFVALILCTLFIFLSLLICIINLIFLINCRFKSVCSRFMLIVVYATNNKFYIMLVYIFASCVSFLTLFTFFTFFNWFVVFFNLFNIKIISICLFFAKNLLNLRVSFLTKMHYLINIVIEIILNTFFFLDL